MITNYHTHTFRCKHARGDVRAYVKEARKQGVGVLGFSDHTPLPDKRWKRVRMRMSELADYCAKIDKARTAFPEIKIYAGLECEYAEEYVGFYKEVLCGQYGLEFLAAGVHWFPFHGTWSDVTEDVQTPSHLVAYAACLCKAMESGLFAFIAHPDMFARSYRKWDANAIAAAKEICVAAKELAVPLEINCYGFRKKEIETDAGSRPGYPLEEFWELAAQYDVGVLVNSDAHRPVDVGDVARGKALAHKYGLKEILLDFSKK
jgi:histidinol-phosphatase (PHP family)